MLKTAVKTAALISVVVALMAGSFYALGTVAHLSYFNALGFDAHQFPELGSELYVSGFASLVLPALFLGVVALFYVCLFALAKRAEDWLSRHPAPAKWRIPVQLLGAAIGVAGIAYVVLSPPGTPMRSIGLVSFFSQVLSFWPPICLANGQSRSQCAA